MTKLKPIFRQVGAHNYSKLGLRRRKKQKYRRPGGGDNKIRLNRAGRVRKVKIGFRNENSQRGLIQGKKPIMIYNINDLKKIEKSFIGIIGKIGNKNKKIIAEKIIKDKISLYKFNAEKFLSDLENKIKNAKENKKKNIEEKKSKYEKAKEKEKKDEDESKKESEEKKLEDKIEEKENKEKPLSEDELKVKEAKIKEK